MVISETLKKLSRAHGLSGREMCAAEAARELLLPYMDSVTIDPFYNVVGIKRCGKENAPVLMFDAHIDQVGFYVQGYAGEGMWYIGETGMDMRLAPSLPVRVLTRSGEEVLGILTAGAGEAGDKPVAAEKLYLDVGLDEAASKALIHPGDPIVCDSAPYELPGGLIYAQAVDDRGCFVALARMAELLQGKELDADIIIQGATREEVGGPSACVSATGLAPDLFFAVDVCHAKTADNPKGEEFRKGPAIARQGTCDPWAEKMLFALAEEHGIAHQEYLISYISGTNAGEVRPAGTGIPCAVVSLPIRYMHAPYEVVCEEDIESLAQLCCSFACEFKGYGKERGA